MDRALGTFTVAEALSAAGCTVEVHDRHFARDARDAQWLAEVGRRGWVVLTKDRHIRTRQSELIALLGAGVAAFVLTAADLSGPEMARLQLLETLREGVEARLHLVPQPTLGAFDDVAHDALDVRQDDLPVEPRQDRQQIFSHGPLSYLATGHPGSKVNGGR